MDKIDLADRLGYYLVGNEKIYSKVEALEKHFKNPTLFPIHWNFNNEIFDKVSWTNEPSENLNYWYAKRCYQLREKYDYLVLHYSGGADSNNILKQFLLNKIRIDEITVMFPFKAWESIKENNLADATNIQNEWFKVIQQDLKFIAKVYPEIKISIYDYTDEQIEFFDPDFDWVHKVGAHLNPNCLGRYNRLFKNESNLILTDQGKQVGHIFGIDKPRVYIDNGKWYIGFLDTVSSMVTTNESQHKKFWEWQQIEFFYWSPDLPQMLVKQAHEAIKLFEKNPNCGITPTNKNTDHHHRHVYNEMIKKAIYPLWDLTIFQCSKPTSVFYGEYDFWFLKTQTETRGYKIWREGIDYISNALPINAFNLLNGRIDSFAGYWSAHYFLKDVK